MAIQVKWRQNVCVCACVQRGTQRDNSIADEKQKETHGWDQS